jgi:hypothetical protein
MHWLAILICIGQLPNAQNSQALSPHRRAEIQAELAPFPWTPIDPPPTVPIQAGRPLLCAPSPLHSNVSSLAAADAVLPVLEARRVWVNHTLTDRYTPLVRETVLYGVRDSDGLLLWYCPDLIATYEDADDGARRRLLVDYAPMPSPEWRAAGLCAAACAMGSLLWRRRRLLRWHGIPDWLSDLAVLVLMQVCVVGLYLGSHGIFYGGWIDGTDYFGKAQDLLHGRLPVGRFHPLGLALLYVPVVWCTQARSLFEIGQLLAYLTSVGWGSLLLAGIYALARSIRLNRRSALAAAIFFAAIPILSTVSRWGFPSTWLGLHDPTEFHARMEFPAVFAEVLSPFSLHHYRAAEWMGLTTLSDTPATALALLGLALLASAGRSVPKSLLAGLILGFGTTVRLSNVLTAVPAVVLLVVAHPRDQRTLLRAGLALAAGWLLAITPLLAENWMLSGSPLISGYQLYDMPGAHGFVPSLFPYGLRYFAELFRPLLWLKVLGLLALAGFHGRWVLIGLMASYFLFYAGYEAGGDEEIRFLLPAMSAGALAIGAAMNRSWGWPVYRWAAIWAVVMLHLILVRGWSDPAHALHWLASLQHSIWTRLALIALTTCTVGLLWRSRSSACLAAALSLLYVVQYAMLAWLALVIAAAMRARPSDRQASSSEVQRISVKQP